MNMFNLWPPPPSPPQGIMFGTYWFTEPQQIGAWDPPYLAALYAVLVPDWRATPRPFRVIYFGESGNLSGRGFLLSHHA